MSDDEFEVVLTPLKGKEPGSHVMRIERVPISHLNKANVQHIAGGPYQGIIINKAAQEVYTGSKSDTERTFTAYVADAKKDSKDFKREKRLLKFWFEELAKVDFQVMEAITDTYFKELMNKEAFPKDYISFVKRVIMLVKQYSSIQKLELIMRILVTGEDDDGVVMNKTLYKSRVTKTTVTTTKTSFSGPGVGQDDHIRLADGTLIDTHGTVVGNDPDTSKLHKGGTYMLNGHKVHIQEDLRRLADGSIVDSHGTIVMHSPDSATTQVGRTYTVTGEAVHIQEDYMRLADGIIVDSHGNIISYGSDSMSMQMGGTHMRNGEAVHIQEDYIKISDGIIVNSHGTIIGNASDPAFVKKGSTYMWNEHTVHIQEDYKRLADGSIVDSHGNIVTSAADSAQMQHGGTYKWNGHTVHIQEDYRREADGSIADSHGNIVVYAGDSMKMQQSGSFMWNGRKVHIQEDYRRLVDGTIVDSHGTIVIDSSGAMTMQQGEMVMRNGNGGPHIQEDYMRLADGTIVDSHGHIVYYGGDVMTMAQGGILQNGGFVNGGYGQPNATSTSKRGQLKKQPTITMKGWDMIWATKKQKLINILEDAYPTVMTIDELVNESGMKRSDVEYLMENLTERGLVKDVDKHRYIRIPQGNKLVIRQGTTQRNSRPSADMDSIMDKSLDRSSMSMDEERHPEYKKSHEFKLVAHIPHLPAKQQPTIAIVTLLFCEKVAVDAMMDFKTTYIRIKKGEGEGLVYTVGKIGPHIIVSTKLSRISGQGASIAAGNTVTRLLGTFGMLEHVMLVGVGGGVISSDDEKHVRLGDIVATKPETANEPVYVHCTDYQEDSTFKIKGWCPKDRVLEKIMSSLRRKSTNQGVFNGEWEKYIQEGEDELTGGEARFSRPPRDSDKLYKVEDNKEVELEHPASPAGSLRSENPNKPMLFLGKIGSGKILTKDDRARVAFTKENNTICIDSGFQAVMDSIEGNRKDSFAVIRGIADYQDGTHRRDWQSYASLVAAAFMKAVILQLSHAEESDDED